MIVKNKRSGLGKILALILFVNSGAQLFATEMTFYVSPKGNDAWSGRKPNPAWNRTDGPLATLSGALTAARSARVQNKDAQIKILLRGGVYELTGPPIFKPEDSGASTNSLLLIAAYRDEKPIISGGKKITGWKKAEGKTNLWSVEIPEVRDGKWYFRQLFINGERRQRARTPRFDYFIEQADFLQTNPAKFRFKPGDVKKSWAVDGDVEAIGLMKWSDFRQQIRAVDETAHVATLSGQAPVSNREPNARYYVENAADALDEPGEWYLDRKTGRLNYLAARGEDLSTAQVVAPRLTQLVRFEGNFAAQQPVRHIKIDGLAFAYADWSLATNGYTGVQAAVEIPGAIFGEGATDCMIQNCKFEHIGSYALDFGRGCQRIKIIGNEVRDIGAGGIRLGEPAIRATAFERNHGHEISDNHIHELGRVFAPAIGVLVLQSGTNHIAHNEIHDLFYTAISIGWTWGYMESPCRENVVEFNHLYDIGQGVLSDMGGIYTLGIQSGTILRNNLIHDVNSFTYGGWGLYTDEGSSNILLENNLVYRCGSAGFHQHYGRENILRNNIFALNIDCQLVRTRAEPHISFFFTNNMVAFNSGTLLSGNWSGGSFVMDNNVYFDWRLRENPNAMKFAGQTFADWQQRGHDGHSTIANPQFVAPGKFDFGLQTNSPALKMGFKPIDLRDVGPRKQSRK